MVLELPKRLRTIALGYELYFSLHKNFIFVAKCDGQLHDYQPCHFLWYQRKESGSITVGKSHWHYLDQSYDVKEETRTLKVKQGILNEYNGLFFKNQTSLS